MKAKTDGWFDGVLGRESKAPKQWPDCEFYLQHYMQGKEYRKPSNITLTYERPDNDTQGA
jgi:hypothetical protein